ncbi:MAG: hypothetical protein ACI8UX_001445 [Psychromonas sp.]
MAESRIFENQIEEEFLPGAIASYKAFLKLKSENEIKACFVLNVYLALGVFLCIWMKKDLMLLQWRKLNEKIMIKF